ncbi:hypothetical protein MN608_01280 [Microdochium nivale]|nr:hypothetical protein MN608_01280 [Microdochium nivale]
MSGVLALLSTDLRRRDTPALAGDALHHPRPTASQALGDTTCKSTPVTALLLELGFATGGSELAVLSHRDRLRTHDPSINGPQYSTSTFPAAAAALELWLTVDSDPKITEALLLPTTSTVTVACGAWRNNALA